MSANATGDSGRLGETSGGEGATRTVALSSLGLAPKLISGALYSQWKPDIEVWLERNGAQGVHSQAMTSAEWRECVAKVEQVKEAARRAALSLVLGRALSSAPSAHTTTSSTSSSATPSKVSDEQHDAMKIVKELVERSTRVFGVIYAALPDELRRQTESIPRGFAYGLWHWLELKFQSTEQDSVGILLEQWVTLKHNEDESFDAYRARVDKLFALLKSADEQPSAGQYSLMLLDRLQPHFKQAVLALKASGQLKDAKAVQWETVAQLLNAHERDQRRADSQEDGMPIDGFGLANAAQARQRTNRRGNDNRGDERRRGANTLTCFFCDGVGHVKRDCPERLKWEQRRDLRRNDDSGSDDEERKQGPTNKTNETAAAARRMRRTRFDDDYDDDEYDFSEMALAATIGPSEGLDDERTTMNEPSSESSFRQTKEQAIKATRESKTGRLLPEASDTETSCYGSECESDRTPSALKVEKRGVKIETNVRADAAGTQGEFDPLEEKIVERILRRRGRVRGDGPRVLVRWMRCANGDEPDDSWELESKMKSLAAYKEFMAIGSKVVSRK